MIQETLDQLSKAWFFTKLNIIHVFNQIHIWEDDEKYTAFQTWWDLFEQLVMLFDLKNEPSIFQHYINDKLHDFLNIFVTAYIDDILIYLFMLSEHQRHVWMILEWLQEAGLQCDIKKCKFHATKIMYLDLIVSHNDIKMNSVKIKVIIDWESSWNIHDVQAFLEFANFYQQFIQHFSKIVQLLMNLIKKNMKFLWDMICEHMFNDLKKWFMTALILAHFDSDLECVLKADSSYHVQEDVLSQYNKNDVLCSIVFFSQKLNAAESNYEIYDKELLTII